MRVLPKRLFIFIFFTVSTTSVFALSLEQAISTALEKNFSIQRENINLKAAERNANHSWNELLPSLSFSANDEITLPAIKGEGKSTQNDFGLEGKASISLSSDFFASIKKNNLDYEAALISYNQALSEVLSQVKEKYFSLLLEKENLDFLRENLINTKNQAEQNQEKYNKGLLPQLEYLSSKLSYEKSKTEVKAKELAFDKKTKSFCLFLGLEDSSLIIEGSLEEYILAFLNFFDEEKKAALEKNINKGEVPSVKLLKKQVEAAQKEVQKTKLSVWGPQANLSYSIRPMVIGDEEGQIKQSASIGLSLPLESLLPFSKGADSIKRAEDSVKDLQLQLEEKAKNVKADFTSILSELKQKEENISSLKNLVNLAQENYSSSQYSYSKGMMEYLSLQNASKEFLEAKLNLQNEYLEYLNLFINLEKICGKSL